MKKFFQHNHKMESLNETAEIEHTDKFLARMKKILDVEDYEYNYVIEMYEEGNTLYDICLAIVFDGDWDGNVLSSGVHGLAEAYLRFSDKKFIDRESRNYLASRSGVMGIHTERPKTPGDDVKTDIFTFMELVEKMGDYKGFNKWLNAK